MFLRKLVVIALPLGMLGLICLLIPVFSALGAFFGSLLLGIVLGIALGLLLRFLCLDNLLLGDGSWLWPS